MAYYSNSGAQIYSGAAGLGQNRGGPLTAFRDGSLGRRRAGTGAANWGRSPMAYQDGSLGGFGAGMGANWGRSPMAFQDGSLGGQGYGPREAFKDGSLGESGPGPLRSFEDGSLGMPLFLADKDGIRHLETPVTIHHGPLGEYFAPRGMGEYFSGMAGCRGCGLGQTSSPTLDLKKPATMLEVKQALVLAPWMLSFLEKPEVAADVEDPVWTKMSSQMVGAWVSGYVDFLYAQPTPPASTKVEFLDALLESSFEGEFFVPNALGIRNIYFGATLGAASVNANPAESFPILTKFLADETASGGEGGVLPPAIEGQETKRGDMLAVGLGMAALVVVGVAVMGGGKRRRK